MREFACSSAGGATVSARAGCGFDLILCESSRTLSVMVEIVVVLSRRVDTAFGTVHREVDLETTAGTYSGIPDVTRYTVLCVFYAVRFVLRGRG